MLLEMFEWDLFISGFEVVCACGEMEALMCSIPPLHLNQLKKISAIRVAVTVILEMRMLSRAYGFSRRLITAAPRFLKTNHSISTPYTNRSFSNGAVEAARKINELRKSERGDVSKETMCIKEAFDLVDEDENGEIDRHCLNRCLISLCGIILVTCGSLAVILADSGHGEFDELNAALEQIKTGKNGVITKQELIDFWSKKCSTMARYRKPPRSSVQDSIELSDYILARKLWPTGKHN
eukprot:766544-Hanusia_phi.AAC.5